MIAILDNDEWIQKERSICNNAQEIPFHHHLFKKRASIKRNSRKTREIVTFAQMVYITDVYRRFDNNHSSPHRSSMFHPYSFPLSFSLFLF